MEKNKKYYIKDDLNEKQLLRLLALQNKAIIFVFTHIFCDSQFCFNI